VSYLDLTKGVPGLGKATVSFWFRIPATTREAARADYINRRFAPAGLNDDLVFAGSIPLLSWGPSVLQAQFTSGVMSNSAFVGPSYIGLQMDDVVAEAMLSVRFQSTNPAGLNDGSLSTGNSFQIGQQQPGGFSYSTEGMPAPDIFVAADTWHHLITSFDVSTGTHGSLWLAFDDHNYNGPQLYPSGEVARSYVGDGGGGSDPNAIDCVFNLFSGWFGYGFDPVDNPFGTPVPRDYAVHNLPVEMAELQIFTGRTLDTSIVDNRRAFIDADGKPVDPAAAALLMGKRPEVLLHGSGNWIAGRNTGSLGLRLPDTVIAAGQFTPTGKIDAYSPGPSLHGDQGTPGLRKRTAA